MSFPRREAEKKKILRIRLSSRAHDHESGMSGMRGRTDVSYAGRVLALTPMTRSHDHEPRMSGMRGVFWH